MNLNSAHVNAGNHQTDQTLNTLYATEIVNAIVLAKIQSHSLCGLWPFLVLPNLLWISFAHWKYENYLSCHISFWLITDCWTLTLQTSDKTTLWMANNFKILRNNLFRKFEMGIEKSIWFWHITCFQLPKCRKANWTKGSFCCTSQKE